MPRLGQRVWCAWEVTRFLVLVIAVACLLLAGIWVMVAVPTKDE